MKENYNEIMKNTIKTVEKGKKLLLHSCCGPCSTAVIEKLKDFFDITVFFYNPNIHDKAEYEKRLSFQKKVCEINNLPLIEGEYDTENFFSLVKGKEEEKEGGERCFICYEMRLYKTAQTARDKGFDFFTTTLTVSPLKNAEHINGIGEKLEKETGVKFLKSDFKKENGYLRSIELSKEYGLYRQNYCGCVFSEND